MPSEIPAPSRESNLPYHEFTSMTKEQARRYCAGSEQQPVRDAVASRIGPTRTVIDLCCGNGIDAPRYARRQYTGVDVSPVLIDAARDLNPGYRFLCADASYPVAPDLAADCVMIKSALEHVPSEYVAKAILREAIRLSRGEVYVAWHTPPRDDVPQSEIRDVLGHFGLTVRQNQYAAAPFRPFRDRARVEAVGAFALWTIRAGPRPTRGDIIERIRHAVGGRPARWTDHRTSIGDFDNREWTVDVFDLDPDPDDALRLPRALVDYRHELEWLWNIRITLISHGVDATSRLYPWAREETP